MDIRAELQEEHYRISNKIALMNSQMETLEKAGLDDTEGYEALAQAEEALCKARMKIRKAIRRTAA